MKNPFKPKITPFPAIMSLLVIAGPTRSCSCGSFNGKSKSGGPLDQILCEVVGSKQLDTIRDERIEDDRQQMDKLKASLSIQAICSNFAHHEKM